MLEYPQGGYTLKILIGYFSETGNTQRIADAMGAEAATTGHDVEIASVSDIHGDQLSRYDAVFLGSTCHSADIALPVRNLLDSIPEGSSIRLAGFATHATFMPEDGAWQKALYERWGSKCPITFQSLCEAKGVDFLGYFHCQGAPNPQIELFIQNTVIPDEKQWEEYIREARSHPIAEDIASARAFTRGVLAKLT